MSCHPLIVNGTAVASCHPYPANGVLVDGSFLDPHHHHRSGHGFMKHEGPYMMFLFGWLAACVAFLVFSVLQVLYNWIRSKATRDDRAKHGCTCFRKRDYLFMPKRYWSNNAVCHCGAYAADKGTQTTQKVAPATAAPATAYNPATTDASAARATSDVAVTNANIAPSADTAAKTETVPSPAQVVEPQPTQMKTVVIQPS